jgi:hypothetical protein
MTGQMTASGNEMTFTLLNKVSMAGKQAREWLAKYLSNSTMIDTATQSVIHHVDYLPVTGKRRTLNDR